MVLNAMGASLNTITRGGIDISISVVVDDAIIGLENVLRRLRESGERNEFRSIFCIVLDATLAKRLILWRLGSPVRGTHIGKSL